MSPVSTVSPPSQGGAQPGMSTDHRQDPHDSAQPSVSPSDGTAAGVVKNKPGPKIGGMFQWVLLNESILFAIPSA